MTQLHPGDRVTVYQYSDPTVTLSDRARLRSASADPWQLPPEGQQWRKLRIWGDWPIVALSVTSDRAIVTSPHFPFPLCSEGVQVPLTHIELNQRGAYASVLERIRNGEPITDASAISADAHSQSDRPSFRRKSRKGGELHRGDRTTADRETAIAQTALF